MAQPEKINSNLLPLKRILAPTDFSPGAEPALRWAAVLAEKFGAELIFLHVLDLNILPMGAFPQAPPSPAMVEIRELTRKDATEGMARLAAGYPRAQTILREGSPRPVILEVSKEMGADLIVMGTHGRTGLAHVFFGSVAEHVVRMSRIPVLTVRQEG